MEEELLSDKYEKYNELDESLDEFKNKIIYDNIKKHIESEKIESEKIESEKIESEIESSVNSFIELSTDETTEWGESLEDNFPYRKYFMPPFKEMFSRLQIYANNIETNTKPSSDYLYEVERTFPEDYDLTDSLVDHFVEQIRVDCAERDDSNKNSNKTKHDSNKTNSQSTPQEIWKLNQESFLLKINTNINFYLNDDSSNDSNKMQKVKELREMVYNKARGCNIFNAALGVFLFKQFKATSLLDCTAGWGDRLIAAIAADVHFYRGWDTNTKLQPVYEQIVKTCSLNSKSNLIDSKITPEPFNWKITPEPFDWKITPEPFEKSTDFFPNNELYQKFDVAFLSPPFYDKEMYEGDNTSTTNYPNINQWYIQFYNPMFLRATLAVKVGGYILAYIPNGRMKQEANNVVTKEGFIYRGIVAFKQIVEGKKPQIRETFVWEKKNNFALAISKSLPILSSENKKLPILSNENKKLPILSNENKKLPILSNDIKHENKYENKHKHKKINFTTFKQYPIGNFEFTLGQLLKIEDEIITSEEKFLKIKKMCNDDILVTVMINDPLLDNNHLIIADVNIGIYKRNKINIGEMYIINQQIIELNKLYSFKDIPSGNESGNKFDNLKNLTKLNNLVKKELEKLVDYFKNYLSNLTNSTIFLINCKIMFNKNINNCAIYLVSILDIFLPVSILDTSVLKLDISVLKLNIPDTLVSIFLKLISEKHFGLLKKPDFSCFKYFEIALVQNTNLKNALVQNTNLKNALVQNTDLKLYSSIQLISSQSSQSSNLSYLIYKNDKSINSIEIKKDNYGYEFCLQNKNTLVQNNDIIILCLLIIIDILELQIINQDSLLYIEVAQVHSNDKVAQVHSNDNLINKLTEIGFKNITTFGHISSKIYGIKLHSKNSKLHLKSSKLHSKSSKLHSNLDIKNSSHCKLSYNGDGIHPLIAEKLNNYGWVKANLDSDLIHFSQKLNNLTNQISLLGNIKEKVLLTDKYKAYNLFKEESFYPNLDKSKYSILKYIKSESGLEKSKLKIILSSDIRINPNDSSSNSSNNENQVIITKYIKHPLLYNGKKINLQVFTAFSSNSSNELNYTIHIYDKYNVQVAKLPYSLNETNLSNKNIHISNMNKTKWIDFDSINIDNNIDILSIKNRIKKKIIKCYNIFADNIFTDKVFTDNVFTNNNTKPKILSSFQLITFDILIESVNVNIVDSKPNIYILDMHDSLESENALSSQSSQSLDYFNWITKKLILPNFGLVYDFMDCIAYKSDQSKLYLKPMFENSNENSNENNDEKILHDLAKIGSIYNIYKYLGKGEHKWDYKYIKELYDQAKDDSMFHCRDYYSWIVMFDTSSDDENPKIEVAGYISIRPLVLKSLTNNDALTNALTNTLIQNNKKNYQIRYFISPIFKGNKLATIAGKKVVYYFHSIFDDKYNLYAAIDVNNIPSLKTALNIGFKKYKIMNEYGKIIQLLTTN